MRFSVLSLIGHDPHPLTGELPSPADRFEEVIATAAVAEELGFDSYSVGERHAGAFLSSSPSVMLGAIAARTRTIRLLTGVTVVAILDPVRVAHGLPPRPPVDHRGRLRAEPAGAVGDAPAVRGGDRPGGAAGGAFDALAVRAQAG
nr:LLM class flavin-dependent oxidoreductase [Streptomyces arboris]